MSVRIDHADGQKSACLPAAVRLCWPAERFFWSVIEAPGWDETGVLPPSLRERFEEDVPGDPGDMHAVCVPIGGRILVCGALRSELSELNPEAVSLVPEELPAFLDIDNEIGNVSRLNLLVGEFEPASLRRTRMNRRWSSVAATLMCVILISIGFIRRELHADAVAVDAQERASHLLASITPAVPPQSLAAEIARLEQVVQLSQRENVPDAGLVLSELLKGWPLNVPAKPLSFAVTTKSATVSVAIEGDTSSFLRAITGPTGWGMAEPRLNTADNIARLTLRFESAEKEAVH